jgi:hypothetical protein
MGDVNVIVCVNQVPDPVSSGESGHVHEILPRRIEPLEHR